MPTGESRLDNRPVADRPAVDEWGIYDPSQAGLSALFDRVEEKRRAAAEPDAQQIADSMREANRLTWSNSQKPETD